MQSRWTRHASHSANRFAGPLWAWRLGQRRACAAAAVGSGVRCQSTAPAQRPPKVLLKSVRRFLQKVIPKFLPGSAEPRVTNPSFGLSRPAPFRLSPGGPYAEGGRGIRRTFLLTPRRGHRGIAHLIRAPFRGLRVCWRTSDKSVVVWPFLGGAGIQPRSYWTHQCASSPQEMRALRSPTPELQIGCLCHALPSSEHARTMPNRQAQRINEAESDTTPAFIRVDRALIRPGLCQIVGAAVARKPGVHRSFRRSRFLM